MKGSAFPAFYMHDSLPFRLARQNDFTDFDAFDLKKKKWVEDRYLFQRVCMDCEYHHITEDEANKVISVLSGDINNMTDDELIDKISNALKK